MRIGNHFIVLGKASKLWKGDQEEIDHLTETNGVSPKFNYSYWFWTPQVKWRPPDTINIITIHWLCYYLYWDNYNLMRGNHD